MADIAYFDSCIFIELLQKNNQNHFDACDELRLKAEKGELVIVTSTLAIIEVNKLPDSKLVSADQSKKIIEFFRNAYISVRAVDRRIAEFAHELTNTHKLANMDAVHIATAVENRVPVLYTYDGMKGKRKGLIRHNGRIGKPGSSPLKICVPPNPLAGTLFELPDQEL